MHDSDLGGVLGGDPVVLIFVVHQLQLTRVRELDHGADGHLELPSLRVVQPDMVSLQTGKDFYYICKLHRGAGLVYSRGYFWTANGFELGRENSKKRTFRRITIFLRRLSAGLLRLTGCR